MIQLQTKLKASDKTSIVKVYCIKVLKSIRNRIAKIGELIIICVNTVNTKKFITLKARFQKRFNVGTMHRGLIIRTKKNSKRIINVMIKFGENTVVIVAKSVVPLSNKVYGPVLREFCIKWPSLGCVSTNIV